MSNMKDLHAYASRLGITNYENLTKEEIVSRIKEKLPPYLLLEIEAIEKTITTGNIHVVDRTGSIPQESLVSFQEEVKNIFATSFKK